MGENTLKKAVAKAVLECYEQIPCDPCVDSCPHGAISITGGIHNTPVLDPDKCIGCGICITHCSGQAIFVVESGDEYGSVSMPYEFLPLPEKGSRADATDRDGKYVCEGVITEVRYVPSFDHTAVVKIRVPAEYTDEVRGFRLRDTEVER